MMMEEKTYTFTIPLTSAIKGAKKRRSPKATRLLRDFIRRHVKPDKIVIAPEVNQAIWARGTRKPPRGIQVRVIKDKDGVASVSLAEERHEEE